MDDETKANTSNSDDDTPKRARRSRIAGFNPRPKIRTARPQEEAAAAPPKPKTRAARPEREAPAAPPEEEIPAAPPEPETAAASTEDEPPSAGRPKRRRRPRPGRIRPKPKIRVRTKGETPSAPAEEETPPAGARRRPRRPARPKPKIRVRTKGEAPAAPTGEETPAARPARKPRPARPKRKIRVRAKGEAPAATGEEETPAARPARKPRVARPAGKRPGRKPGGKRPPRKRRARPRRKKGPSYEDLTGDVLLEGLKKQFPDEILSGQSFLGQSIYTVKPGVLYDVMLALRDHSESPFDYLIDVSTLDYLGDQERFLMVYQLYSYASKKLLRIKSRFGEGDPVPSMTSIWKTADWLEREVYDMFGILFSGHPDLKRILLPDDWHGYPLRKDYDIKLQDQSWIRNHLTIRKTPD